MPKISIVVPVYNPGTKLKKCIKSILRQSFSDFELILVNDGSTDGSGQVCDKFASMDARIHVIHQQNQGSIAARRAGVARCSGEFSCFCDSDDILPSGTLSVLSDNICDADVLIGNSCKMWRGIKLKSRHIAPCFEIDEPVKYHQSSFISELYCSWFGISNVPVSLWGKLYRTDLLKKVYHEVPPVVHFLGEDLIVTLNLMPQAKKTIIIPDCVYYYRMGGGTSKYNPHMLDDWLALYRYKEQFAERYPMPQDTKKLMDIELCNMVFSYFHMLGRSELFTESDLLDQINRVSSIPEVTAACRNPAIPLEQFSNIRLLHNNNSDAILSEVLLDAAKYKKTKLVRNLIKKFA